MEKKKNITIKENPLLGIKVFSINLEYISETEKIMYKLDIREILEKKLESDIEGRDFIINAIYYKINNYKLLDLVKGIEDIKKKQICLISSPEYIFNSQSRFFRIVRFKIELGFEISEDIKKYILNTDFRELYEKIHFYPNSFLGNIRKVFKSEKTAEILEYMKEFNMHFFFQFELEKIEFDKGFNQVIFLIKKIEKLLFVEKHSQFLEKFKIENKIGNYEEILKILAFSFVFFKKYPNYSKNFLTKIFLKNIQNDFIQTLFDYLKDINVKKNL